MQMGQPRILIACIGNIFLGDDAFGVEVAQRLQTRCYPQGVQVIDFGIRGLDLAYTLLDGYDSLVLVDAVSRGGAPGTLYLLEPDLAHLDVSTANMSDGHSMDPVKMLAFAQALGVLLPRTLLVGCEPAVLGGDDGDCSSGLSAPVHTAIDEAVRMIDTLVTELSIVTEAAQQKCNAAKEEQQWSNISS